MAIGTLICLSVILARRFPASGFPTWEVEFGIQSHQLESGLDTNVKEEITVNAGEHRRTEIYYIREIYNGPYRVYASNPSTGKKQVFSGEISSERIIGYKIISYNIKEDENRQENN